MDNRESEMLYPLLGNVFDANVFNKMIKADARGTAFSVDSVTASLALENLAMPAGNPQLRNHNEDIINQLIFTLHERKSSFVGEIRLLLFQKQDAKDLINLINKEYHLKDE